MNSNVAFWYHDKEDTLNQQFDFMNSNVAFWYHDKEDTLHQKLDYMNSNVAYWYHEKEDALNQQFDFMNSNVAYWYHEKEEDIVFAFDYMNSNVAYWYKAEKYELEVLIDTVLPTWYKTEKNILDHNIESNIPFWYEDKRIYIENRFDNMNSNLPHWYVEGEKDVLINYVESNNPYWYISAKQELEVVIDTQVPTWFTYLEVKPEWYNQDIPHWYQTTLPEWFNVVKPTWADQTPIWFNDTIPDWYNDIDKYPLWYDYKLPSWYLDERYSPTWYQEKVPQWYHLTLPRWFNHIKPAWFDVDVPCWYDDTIPKWYDEIDHYPYWYDYKVPLWYGDSDFAPRWYDDKIPQWYIEDQIRLKKSIEADYDSLTVEIKKDLEVRERIACRGDIVTKTNLVIEQEGNDNSWTIGTKTVYATTAETVEPTESNIGDSNDYSACNVNDNGEPVDEEGNVITIEQEIILNSELVQSSDLIIQSKNGSITVFHDMFAEGVFNFTGQHRCTIFNKNIELDENTIGQIVRSANCYDDLYDKSTIRIDEAVPVIELTTKAYDKAAFGVISGEENDEQRIFSLGHMSFHLQKDSMNKKLIINSVGEGCIWVCDTNGYLENGDYITTSDIAGLGMRQDDDIRHNYTVAKVTCDCSFDLNSTIYKCVSFKNEDGKIIKKAFVGCIYCC